MGLKGSCRHCGKRNNITLATDCCMVCYNKMKVYEVDYFGVFHLKADSPEEAQDKAYKKFRELGLKAEVDQIELREK